MNLSGTRKCDWCGKQTSVFHELYRKDGKERLDRPLTQSQDLTVTLPAYAICPECARDWCDFHGCELGDNSVVEAGRFTQRRIPKR